MENYTEDKVRDIFREKTGIDVGQQTTFKELGFTKNDESKFISEHPEFSKNKPLNWKPDGWYFSDDKSFAIVSEMKSSNKKIKNEFEQLKKYSLFAQTKFKNVVSIIFNGKEHEIYLNSKKIEKKPKELQKKEWYFNLIKNDLIDKKLIYNNTKKINDLLHFSFSIKSLNNRMIWTACILVAIRYGQVYNSTDSLQTIKSKTVEKINKQFEKDISLNIKLNKLIETFDLIRPAENVSSENIQLFIESIEEIADNINSSEWNGEDVMAIFFNEFNRYKAKSENGQVFTPDHITSLMARIADIRYDDKVLDAACGSGSFLTKAMYMMISETGGSGTKEAKKIKKERIFGVENDVDIFSLACANMLIHKDGKSNIILGDSTNEKIGQWIKDNKINKVLMNPPYETKYGPIDIIINVLDNIEKNSSALFLLPNSKIRTAPPRKREHIFKNHTIEKIIKLPNIFAGMASTGDVSIFIFKSGVPQKGNKIVGFNIEHDGLETVKNQGRHDVNNIWKNKYEDYWVEAIKNSNDSKYGTMKIIDPINDEIEYPPEEYSFEISDIDFEKTILSRMMFEDDKIRKELSPKTKENPDGLDSLELLVKLLKE